jgi:(p)ppGpp synthase/HD superfamily hydrolase
LLRADTKSDFDHRRHWTPVHLDFIVDYFDYTAERQEGPKAIPYINQPIAVADLLVRTGNISDSKVIATAFLHDTIEDTRTTKKELKAEFGAAIAELVPHLAMIRARQRKSGNADGWNALHCFRLAQE